MPSIEGENEGTYVSEKGIDRKGKEMIIVTLTLVSL